MDISKTVLIYEFQGSRHCQKLSYRVASRSYINFEMNNLRLQDQNRPTGVISPSKLTRIPRWCQNKLPPINPSTCPPKSVSQKASNIFTKNELIGICEPPSLRKEELKKVWKAKAQRKEVDDHLRDTIAHVDFLKSRLKEVKVTIETISARLESTNMSPYNEFPGEGCNDREVLVDMAKENMRLQSDLLDSLDLEENLTRDLQNAHRQLWEAGVAEQFYSTEIEEKVISSVRHYDKRKAFMAQKRILREKLMKQNAEVMRAKTLSTVVECIKKSANIPSKKSLTSVKVLGIKNARRKVDTFIRKTMTSLREKKLLESCDQRMKQDHQLKLLSNLKQELDEQKDILKIQNGIRQRRAARIAQEKLRIREDFANSGKNPYFIEHLLIIEEKRAEQQRQILAKEQERLAQLQRDFETEEKVKRHEEVSKRKWAKFWQKRLKERKSAIFKRNEEFLDKSHHEDHHSGRDNYHHYEEGIPEPPPPSVVSTVKSAKDIEDVEKMKAVTAVSTKSVVKSPIVSSAEVVVLPRMSAMFDSTASEGSVGSKGSKKRSSSNKSITKVKKVSLKGSPRNSMERRVSRNKGQREGAKSLSFLEVGGEDYEDIVSGTGTLDYQSSIRSEEYEGESDFNFLDDHRSSMKKEKRDSRLKSVILNPADVSRGTAVVTSAYVHTASGAIKKHGAAGDAKPKFVYKRNKRKSNLPSFRWEPTVVVFSDYEVGTNYRKTLTITNISTERVKFFLKEFVDLTHPDPKSVSAVSSAMIVTGTGIPITELVTIKSAVSKPISPGLTHDIHLTFTPPALKDWKGVLRFESNMEPFQIYVECLRKRLVPMLTPNKATFNNVVATTSAFVTLKLKNVGAKNGFIAKIVGNFPEMGDWMDHIDISQSETFSHQGSNVHVLEANSSSHSHRSIHHDDHHSPKSPNSSNVSHTPSETRESASHHDSSDNSRESHSSLKKHKSFPAKRKEVKQAKSSATKMVKEIIDEVVNSITDNIFIAYVKEAKRDLNSGTGRSIVVVFRPPAVDTFKGSFDIHFDDEETEKVTFQVVGNAIENPVFAEPLNTDFKICMMDHNFQQTVSVTTTIRGAGKVFPEVPKELRPFVDVTPKIATVFANSPGKFSVKLRPTPLMIQDGHPALKYIERESLILDFPVNFHLKFPFKVESPLVTTFMAILTNQVLEISPAEIDMGKCSSNETVQASFSILNRSTLPQHIGFVGVPECITIQPNFGFATLLPDETRAFNLLLSLPESATGEMNFHLKCQTLERRESILNIKAMTKKNHVKLSQSRIYFPATAVGSVSATTIEVFSTSPDIRSDIFETPKFEFSIDPNLPIKIIPQAGFIPIGKSTKVQVRFEAQVWDNDVKAHLLQMLEREYIETQAMKQRELEGINQTLKYEMGFDEGDFDKEFMSKIVALQEPPPDPELNKNKKPRSTIIERRGTMKREKRSSYIKQAPVESNIRLGSQASSDPPVTPSQTSNDPLSRKESKRKSKAEGSLLSVKKTESGRSKPLSEKSSKEDKKVEFRKSVGAVKSGRSSLSKVKSESKVASPETPEDPKMKMMMQTYKILESRRDELVRQLAVPYEPPNVDGVEASSREFQKAKRDLMKHLTASSHLYTIPCFITDQYGEMDVLLLYLKCPNSNPSLISLEESNTINFGTVVVGTKNYRDVRLYNVSPAVLKLKLDILNPFGPFLQCNALRKIPSDHIFTLKLRFKPQDIKNYEETIRIKGGDSLITITLVGSAVAPEFSLKPTKNDFYVGTIDVGEFGYQQFEITNASTAELEFTVELLKQGYYEGTSAIPDEASIPPTNSEVLKQTNLRPSTPDDFVPPPSAVKSGVSGEGIPKKSVMNKKSVVLSVASIEEEEASETYMQIRPSILEPLKRRSTVKSPSSIGAKKSLARVKTPRKSTSKLEPLFEVKDENNGITKLTTKELVAHLDRKKEEYFFQGLPSSVKVPSKGNAKFEVYFVPAASGRFFAEFQVRLYQTIVHQFSIVGVGQNLRASVGELE